MQLRNADTIRDCIREVISQLEDNSYTSFNQISYIFYADHEVHKEEIVDELQSVLRAFDEDISEME